MTTSEEFDDPFLRHFQRDPLPDAGIRIILLTDLPADRAETIIAPLADHLRAMERVVETRIVSRSKTVSAPPWPAAWPATIADGAGHDGRGSRRPRLTSIRSWRRSTTAITSSAGGRPGAGSAASDGWRRGRGAWCSPSPRDIHSPCRLHRLDKLAAIRFNPPRRSWTSRSSPRRPSSDT